MWLLQASFVLPVEVPRSWGIRLRTELREGLEASAAGRLSSTELRPGARLFWSSPRLRLQLDELLTLRSFSHSLDEYRIENSTQLQLGLDVLPKTSCSVELLRFSGEASAAVEALGSAGLLLASQQGFLERQSLAVSCSQELSPRLQSRAELGLRREETDDSLLLLQRPAARLVYRIPTGELFLGVAISWAEEGVANELRLGGMHAFSETLSLRAELGLANAFQQEESIISLFNVDILRAWGAASLSTSREVTAVLAQGFVSVWRGYVLADGYLSPRLASTLQLGQSFAGEEKTRVLELSLRRKLSASLWLSLRYSWQQEQNEAVREERRLVFVGLLGAMAAGQVPRSGLAALGNW